MPDSVSNATRAKGVPGKAEKPIVAAQDLTKIFKDFWLRDRARAVDGITFHINRGEIFGLLGPNGAGKSTTIKLVLGLLKKSSGRLQVFGRSPTDVEIKRRIGYLPEESYLYPFLNARETLDYYAKLFRLDRRTRLRRIDELLDMVGLSGVQHRQVREYSKGMQRRIGLAQALINDPELLILDEPTTGLDPLGTRQVKELILELGRRGKTIVLSSHLLADVEDCVTRMVILYGGKIRQEGTCDDLLVTRSRSVIETESLDEATLADIRRVLEQHHKRLDRISAPRQRLEELFVQLVERARTERLATSGAQHGGSTASFLKSMDADDGDRLLDRLVRDDAETAIPKRESIEVESRQEAKKDAVIDSLLDAYDEDSGQMHSEATEQAPERSSRRESEQGPDVDVIDSLLSDAEHRKGDDAGEGDRGR